MRIITASVIIAALCLGTPAFAQAQGASPQPGAQEAPAQSSTVIRSIQVVDIKQLQPAVRAKVDEVVAQTSEDLRSLRKSIGATPEAATALKAKGLSSSHVVARRHRFWQRHADACLLAGQDLLAVEVAAVGDGFEFIDLQNGLGFPRHVR